jgi:Fe-S-cluster containining protein
MKNGPSKEVRRAFKRFKHNKPMHFTKSFIEQMKQIERLPFSQAERTVMNIIGTLQLNMEEIRSSPPSSEKAMAFHEYVSKAIQRGKGDRPASCRKGCAHCCHLLVDITKSEALLLADAARALSPEKKQRLKEQASWPNDPMFFVHQFPKSRCVFLADDNSCSIYERRPMACRAHFVISDPVHCDTEKSPGNTIQTVAYMDAEGFISAAYEADSAAALSKQLLPFIEDANG